MKSHLLSLISIFLLTSFSSFNLSKSLSHDHYIEYSITDSGESRQTRYNFIRPYIENWFIDLLPSERSLEETLNSTIKNLCGVDSLNSYIFLSINPNDDRQKPDFSLYFMNNSPSEWGKTIKSFYLSYDNEEDEYTNLTQSFSYVPSFFMQGISAIKGQGFDFAVDLNGDQLVDIIQAGDTTRTPLFGNETETKFFDLRVYINTGFGYVREKDLAQFIYDFRIGYIGGYYLGFNNSFSTDPKTAVTTDLNKNITSQASYAILPEKAYKQNLSLDSRYICSNYENLKNRNFLNGNRNQVLFVGLKSGYSAGKNAGDKIKTSVSSFDANTRSLQTLTTPSNLRDTVILANNLIDYNDEFTKFSDELLKIPLFNIILKNRNTGKTVSLNDLYNSKEMEIVKMPNNESSYAAFTQKINRPVFESSVPFFKPLNKDSIWYICNPSILAGQISAYLSILTIVNNTDFLETIPSNNFDNNFWTNLRNASFANVMPYNNTQIQQMSISVPGIFSLEFREGYRDIVKYIDMANSEINRNIGREEATKEIIEYLKQEFSDFKPSNSITTPQQAKVEIARFISSLYSVIQELELTINKLNYEIDKLSETNQILQTTLINANKRLSELEGLISKLTSAASNLDRTLNVIANTAEVAYWGSSTGVTYTVGNYIGERLNTWFD